MRPNPNLAIERIRQLELEVKHCGESAMGTSNGVFAVRRGPTPERARELFEKHNEIKGLG